jgi:hypothetical protein
MSYPCFHPGAMKPNEHTQIFCPVSAQCGAHFGFHYPITPSQKGRNPNTNVAPINGRLATVSCALARRQMRVCVLRLPIPRSNQRLTSKMLVANRTLVAHQVRWMVFFRLLSRFFPVLRRPARVRAHEDRGDEGFHLLIPKMVMEVTRTVVSLR